MQAELEERMKLHSEIYHAKKHLATLQKAKNRINDLLKMDLDKLLGHPGYNTALNVYRDRVDGAIKTSKNNVGVLDREWKLRYRSINF